jgi:nitrate reductase delta subunit
MSRSFKALSALLSYPTPELQAATSEIKAILATQALVPAALWRQLDRLIDDIANGDLYDLQERYILLFDRTRSLSLHLFEHVHGESRDRGQAMAARRGWRDAGPDRAYPLCRGGAAAQAPVAL